MTQNELLAQSPDPTEAADEASSPRALASWSLLRRALAGSLTDFEFVEEESNGATANATADPSSTPFVQYPFTRGLLTASERSAWGILSSSWLTATRPTANSISTGQPLGVVNSAEQRDEFFRRVVEGSRWHRYVIERFASLAEDAGRPGRPTLETLDRAWSRIESLLPPSTATPSVTPSENGGVDLFWQRQGWDVGIELGPDGVGFVWARHRPTGESDGGELELFVDYLRDVLATMSQD